MLIKFVESIESLAKSRFLREGDVESYLKELLLITSKTLGCNRVNAWVFNDGRTSLHCLMAYTNEKKCYSQGMTLEKSNLPNYFQYLEKNKIIVSDNAQSELMNVELLDSYLIPYDIQSMIDVPVRSEGQMTGVICFEHVGKKHKWKREERKYAQSIAQLVSLALETEKKNNYRHQLESLLKQKELLISEINHRVKNNISIILSLIRLQKEKAKDSFHKILLDDIGNKLFSMAAVQEQLHRSKYIDKISSEEYLKELVINLNRSFGYDKHVQLVYHLKTILLDITKAIPLALIANEVITNSYKYAFGPANKSPVLIISTDLLSNNMMLLQIRDNGPGIEEGPHKGMGLDIIEGLCAQIDSDVKYENDKGCLVSFCFPL